MAPRRTTHAAAVLAALALLVAGCGDDDTDATAATGTTAVEPVDTTEATTTTEADAAEPEAPAAPGVDADRVVEVTVTGTTVEGGGRQPVSLGETVALVVTADTDDEIHVHGYDLYADVVAGEPTTVTFEASLPGVWEVELHDARLPLVELEVR